jgi:voltage-gated potassium channel
VLDAHDLHVLMDREPRIAEHIREVARARVGGDMITRKGDLVVEELDEAETIHQAADNRSRS